MAWWTNPNIQLKQKNRFIMSIGEFLIPTVVSVDKPKVQIESKEYTMINHVYRYPGIAKWQPITVTFVDGSGNSSDTDGEYIENIDNLDAAQMLYNILLGSGYYSGGSVYGSTSKVGMINNSFGNSIRIAQIEPDGNTISEGWKLHNPIFTDIGWGSLSYSDDTAVEYTISIAYDWAEFYVGGKASKGSYSPYEKGLRNSDELKRIEQVLAEELKGDMDALNEQISTIYGAQAINSQDQRRKDFLQSYWSTPFSKNSILDPGANLPVDSSYLDK